MTASGPTSIVSIRNVTVRFGGIIGLDGVSFDMDAGPIVGLIGPNGAGKTTRFLVHVLKQSGHDLSRENIMRQTGNLKELFAPHAPSRH